MFSSSKPSKEPVLFDIRIQNADDDILVVKGSPEEAPSVLLTGTIVLSVLEPIQIKALKLGMYGQLQMKIFDDPTDPGNNIYSKFGKRIFEYVWDDFNLENCFKDLYTNMGVGNTITSNSSDDFMGLTQKSKSSASLMSFGSNQTSNHRTLVKGNYEFPFSAILPGNLIESVTGLPNASVRYSLYSTLQRSRHQDIICERQVRVIRTISSDVTELSETVAVDNTWPDKVDYSISVPAKALAIGSSTPISILIVPLLKKLTLGLIKVTLVEQSQYCGSYGMIHNQERIVCKLKLKDPLSNGTMSNANPEEEDFEFQGSWEIVANLKIPANLSKCTQDCTIMKNIKVRHKLKFVISLINPDGHVSQLRASLPVQLFVSPFIPLTVKDVDSKIKFSGKSNEITPDFFDDSVGSTNEEVIFSRAVSGVELTDLQNNVNSNNSSTNLPERAELTIPPQYDRYIYDRVFSTETSAANTPIASGLQSPVEYTRTGSIGNLARIDFQQLNINKNNVDKNYYAPAFASRQEDGVTASSVPVDENGFNSSNPFSSPLVRNVSFDKESSLLNLEKSSSSLPPPKEWEIKSLSRVPSYDVAMKSKMFGKDLPPMYPNEEFPLKNSGLERPKEAKFKSSTSLHVCSRQLPKQNQRIDLLRKSKSNINIPLTVSTYPSPSSSSSSSLEKSFDRQSSEPPTYSSNKKHTLNKKFGFGMTQVGSESNNVNSSEVAKPHARGEVPPLQPQRTSSFNNLKELFGRKEKL